MPRAGAGMEQCRDMNDDKEPRLQFQFRPIESQLSLERLAFFLHSVAGLAAEQ